MRNSHLAAPWKKVVEKSRGRSKTAEAGRKQPKPASAFFDHLFEFRKRWSKKAEASLTGHIRTAKNPVNFGHVGKCHKWRTECCFLAMFRRTGGLSANFGSFRTRRKHRTFGKWRTCRVVISSGQFRTRRTAEFLTNTHCSSGETRNILLGVDVGYRWQVAFRLSSNRRTR